MSGNNNFELLKEQVLQSIDKIIDKTLLSDTHIVFKEIVHRCYADDPYDKSKVSLCTSLSLFKTDFFLLAMNEIGKLSKVDNIDGYLYKMCIHKIYALGNQLKEQQNKEISSERIKDIIDNRVEEKIVSSEEIESLAKHMYSWLNINEHEKYGRKFYKLLFYYSFCKDDKKILSLRELSHNLRKHKIDIGKTQLGIYRDHFLNSMKEQLEIWMNNHSKEEISQSLLLNANRELINKVKDNIKKV